MEKWTLRWENYPGPDRLESIQGTSTIIFYVAESAVHLTLAAAERWLIAHGFTVEPLRDDHGIAEGETAWIATRGPDTVLYSSSYSDAIILRVSDEGISKRLEMLLSESAGNGFHSVAKVEHGTRVFAIDGWEGEGTVRTGTLRPEGNRLVPYKFYAFWQRDEVLAKALVNHINLKMEQTGPSIEMFEVREAYRGRGLGRRLLERVEEDARHDGFACVRSTHDRSALGFWKHMGYELDLDEGRKGLLLAMMRTGEPLRTEG